MSVLLFALSPSLYTLFVYGLYAFFGQQAITNTVQEAMGWSAERAWYSFNYGLLLLAGGILVVLYRNLREEHPHHIFALTWALVMLLSTWQHIRYEYYLAICIALLCCHLCSVCYRPCMAGSPPGVRNCLDDGAGGDCIGQETGAPSRKKAAKHARKKSDPSSPTRIFRTVLAVLVIGLSVLFVYSSVSDILLPACPVPVPR